MNPVLRMKIKGSLSGRASSLRTTPDEKTLLINNEDLRIIASEINDRGDIGTLYNCRQVTIEKTTSGKIADFHPFGVNGVAILTTEGWLSIHQFDFDSEQTFEISKTKIPMGKEEAITLTICPKTKVFVCHTSHSEAPYGASRVVIFELINLQFEFMDAYHLFDSGLSSFHALSAHGYYEQDRNLLITAVTYGFDDLSYVVTLCYDVLTHKVRELGNIRQSVRAKGLGRF